MKMRQLGVTLVEHEAAAEADQQLLREALTKVAELQAQLEGVKHELYVAKHGPPLDDDGNPVNSPSKLQSMRARVSNAASVLPSVSLASFRRTPEHDGAESPRGGGVSSWSMRSSNGSDVSSESNAADATSSSRFGRFAKLRSATAAVARRGRAASTGLTGVVDSQPTATVSSERDTSTTTSSTTAPAAHTTAATTTTATTKTTTAADTASQQVDGADATNE